LKQIFLHIGTDKTGSTSLQRWLREKEHFLRENGYALFRGKHTCKNHIELYLAAMRYERDSFAKQSLTDVHFDREYTNEVADRVQAFISESAHENIIFTSEGLSLLGQEKELRKLARILNHHSASIKIIVFLRKPADYLKSYRTQLMNRKGRRPSRDYWSALYVENDTWLTDYSGLLDVYGEEFGAENICVIDYDEQMQAKGNIIPSFLDLIGLEASSVDVPEFDSYRDNKTLSAGRSYSLRRLARSFAKRCGLGL